MHGSVIEPWWRPNRAVIESWWRPDRAVMEPWLNRDGCMIEQWWSRGWTVIEVWLNSDGAVNIIRTMFNRKLLSLAYNCYYRQSPAALQSLFTKSSPVYSFRRKMIFSLPKPRSDILRKSISYQAAALWNSLDNSTRGADSLPSFKKLIRNWKWNFMVQLIRSILMFFLSTHDHISSAVISFHRV